MYLKTKKIFIKLIKSLWKSKHGQKGGRNQNADIHVNISRMNNSLNNLAIGLTQDRKTLNGLIPEKNIKIVNKSKRIVLNISDRNNSLNERALKIAENNKCNMKSYKNLTNNRIKKSRKQTIISEG